MKLLLINFEMDPASQVLSWQFRIACELAAHCEKVVVLTERSVSASLPANVEVHAVPRLFVRAPLRLFGAKWLMNIPAIVWAARNVFDACFIHMNMEWSYRLFPVLRLFRIPLLLWYAHGTVTWRLKLADRCADRVITSTPEGYRIPSAKVHVIGQGIDTELFSLAEPSEPLHDIISVGRISRRKRTDLLVAALVELKKLDPGTGYRLVLIGAPISRDDHEYLSEIKELAATMGVTDSVYFAGHVAQERIPAFYRTAFLHANVSKTGSMDKTVMESLACGCPVLTSNEAFLDLFSEWREFLLEDDSPVAIAARINSFHRRRNELPLRELRGLVERKHDLESYICNIMNNIKSLVTEDKSN